jgi:hypothetical protein
MIKVTDLNLLRHFLATLNYRFTKAIKNAPKNYPTFSIGSGVRSPIEILSHMSFVLCCAQAVFKDFEPEVEEIGTWEEELNRFYRTLVELEQLVSEGLPEREMIAEKLLQGPFSDVKTHIGQLSIIRRLVGDPITKENFFNANIISI